MLESEYYYDDDRFSDRSSKCSSCGKKLWYPKKYHYTYDMWNDRPVTWCAPYCDRCNPPRKPHCTAARIRHEKEKV